MGIAASTKGMRLAGSNALGCLQEGIDPAKLAQAPQDKLSFLSAGVGQKQKIKNSCISR